MPRLQAVFATLQLPQFCTVCRGVCSLLVDFLIYLKGKKHEKSFGSGVIILKSTNLSDFCLHVVLLLLANEALQLIVWVSHYCYTTIISLLKDRLQIYAPSSLLCALESALWQRLSAIKVEFELMYKPPPAF